MRLASHLISIAGWSMSAMVADCLVAYVFTIGGYLFPFNIFWITHVHCSPVNDFRCNESCGIFWIVDLFEKNWACNATWFSDRKNKISNRGMGGLKFNSSCKFQKSVTPIFYCTGVWIYNLWKNGRVLIHSSGVGWERVQWLQISKN